LWHGAASNFILWGAWHGLGLVIYRTWNRFRPANKNMPVVLAWFLTMLFVGVGWVFFRCRSMEQIADFAGGLGCFTLPLWWLTYVKSLLLLAAPLGFMHVWQAHHRQAESFMAFNRPARALLEGIMCLAIVTWWNPLGASFIYFQF